MKKRFFAIFLAVCLVVTLLPAGVLAADGETVSVGGEELSGSAQTPAYATTDDEGNVTVGGSEDSYNVKWNGETLTLNGATIKGNSGNGIVYREGDLTISLEGTNKIGEEYDGNSAASGIHVDGDLTVEGDGTLDVVGLNSGITASNATFRSGEVYATATVTAGVEPMGIYAGSVTVDGGTVTAVAEGSKGYGIYTTGGVTVTDGSVTAKGKVNGIQTQGDVNISGGKVVAEGGNVGIWVTANQGFAIEITGGEVTVTGGLMAFYKNVTIEPEKDTAITVEYGDSASECEPRTFIYNDSYTYITTNHYFHSSTETDISKLANITVGGVGLYGTDYRIAYAKTDNDGNVTVGGSEDNYNIKWDGTTLTLKDATIKVYKPHDGIEYSGTSPITIQLEGENTVTGYRGIGTYNADVAISGSGTLNVNGVNSHAIYARGDIEISDATVNATGTGDYSSSNGISTDGGDIIINSGKVTVKSQMYGLNANYYVYINGGTVSVKSDYYGVDIKESLTIRGGTVTIEAGKLLIRNPSDKVTIAPQDGAKITVKVGDSKNNVKEIEGSPFGSQEDIRDHIDDDEDKYFHSETSGETLPEIAKVTVDPAAAEVEVGETQRFTAEVKGTGYYNRSVVWTVSVGKSAGTFISSNGVLTVATDETATTLTVTATAVGDSNKSATANVTVKQPATITGVTVTPATATVEVGETKQFTATVTGTGSVSQEVTWSVSGSNNAGTTISKDGVLTVAADETAATLTVTATAAGDDNKSATATVTVTHPDPDEPWNPGGGTTGNRYCYLTFETRGGSEIDSLRVKLGETVSLDEYLSERAGFDFAGWYSDDSFAESVDELYMNGSKTVYAAWEPFDDAGRGDWFYDSVVYVYENGLMDGVSDTLFDPDGTVTRAQLVTMLWRHDGEPSVNYALPFTDVSGGEWYAEAVRWAAGEGIVNGVSETEFAPNAAVTREQLAAILHRYTQHKGYDVSIGESTNILSYSDFASISEYAISAMQWACGEGIITGVTESTLEPRGTATRAQSAAILMRFLEG